MAGDWIKWCKGLARKREIAVIASRFKRDQHEIAGRLMCLWEWCDENMDDADFEDEDAIMSLGDRDSARNIIDLMTGITGMADALESPEVNWLTIGDGRRVRFKKLRRHNGTTAKQRASNQRRKARERESGKNCHGSSVTESGPEREAVLNSKQTSAAATAQCIDRGMQGGKGKRAKLNGATAVMDSLFGAPPAGFQSDLDSILGIISLELGTEHGDDQLGFLAQLAWANAAGMTWPCDNDTPGARSSLWPFVAKAKRKARPAGYLTNALRKAGGPEWWESFLASVPSPGYCQMMLLKLGRGEVSEAG